MKIIRCIQPDDYDKLLTFAKNSSVGMTSLPKEPKLFEERFQIAISTDDLTFFVLEDLETKELEGMCGIYTKTGVLFPSFFFRIEEHQGLHILNPKAYTKDEPGYTEICALYLRKESRKSGLGKMLSLSRFLFIAAHPDLFTDHVMAEMRGFIDENQSALFFNHISKPFFHRSFTETLTLYQEHPMEIFKYLPDHPIYIELLPTEAQKTIGSIHPSTEPALNILKSQGFTISNDVDVFDGGPKIIAETNRIQTIAKSKLLTVSKIADISADQKWLLSNERQNNFRVCMGTIQIEGEEAMLSEEGAKALELKKGDRLRALEHF